MKRLAAVFALVAVTAACNNSPGSDNPNGTDSLGQYGIPQGMSWDQSVQGQWCNSDGHAAEAQAVAQTSGITFEDACTKLWAIEH